MPKIINRQEKREIIAKNTIELILLKGFKGLCVSEVAKHSNISKGSIYSYFDSKDDIIYEIINIFYKDYNKYICKKIENTPDIKEKIFILFELCLSSDNNIIRLRKVYREFLSVCLYTKDSKLQNLLNNTRDYYLVLLEKILKKGIKEQILIDNSIVFAKPLFLMADAYLVFGESYYNKELLIDFINSLFKIIRKDKDEKTYSF